MGDETALAKDEKNEPWNVDTMSKETESRTIINKPKTVQDLSKLSNWDRINLYNNFVEENTDNLREFATMEDMSEVQKFLNKNPDMICETCGNFLTIFSIDLAQEKKWDLFEKVTKQAVVMQFILEMAKNAKMHPTEPKLLYAFFYKWNLGRKVKMGREFAEAYDEELINFRERTKERAILRDENKTEEER